MNLITVAAASLNQTPLDWERNTRNILRAIKLAKQQGVNVLCLPELCITGYGCEDAFHSPGLIETAWKILQDVLPNTKGITVSIGLPIFYQHGLFNTSCLMVDGRIVGCVAKRFLAGDGIHYEPRWFKPWPQGTVVQLKRDGTSYPLGDIYFDVSGIKLGFEICEDAWVARRPGGELALKGVDIILNPSASHFAFGKHEVRKRLVLEASRAFGVAYVYANLLGCEAGRIIYDGEALVAAGGKILAAGQRFSFDDVVITSAQIDLEQLRMDHARTASFQPGLNDQTASCVVGAFTIPKQPLVSNQTQQEPWESSPEIKQEEFTRAVTLGLFDYLRKSRTQGFVVSLSGGADSSAVSCLVALMVELGLQKLGRKRFLEALSPIEGLQTAHTAKQLVHQLLTTVYQSTRNSSATNRNAARRVAEALGARHLEFDVDSLVDRYVDMVSKQIRRSLTWKTDDITLQNIQARVRGPGVWLVANERNALLLVTSNRSEAAVGYATMDGDTCGGLCPIGGIDKAFLRQWLHWMETTGPSGLEACPILKVVNQQTPTAELRPSAKHQTDEADLMPYQVLDAIERLAIRDKKTPLEIFPVLQREFSQTASNRTIAMWIERFFRLWCRNQWKRERYAPSFHLDDENLDPKTWCRFPILSGGYERELHALNAYVKRLSSPKRARTQPKLVSRRAVRTKRQDATAGST